MTQIYLFTDQSDCDFDFLTNFNLVTLRFSFVLNLYFICLFSQVRSHTRVMYVVKHSPPVLHSTRTGGSTPGRNHISVRSVANDSPPAPTSTTTG